MDLLTHLYCRDSLMNWLKGLQQIAVNMYFY